jgi:hypothetical protein
MIINFEKFLLEIKLADVFNIKGDYNKDIFKKIKQYDNNNFIEDVKFKKYITLNKRIDNKKTRFKIQYNHNLTHDLITRIKNRTNLKSISEFNDKIEYIINELFPNKLDKDINVNGLYSIYLKNSNYTVSFDINYNDIKHKIYDIF